MRVSAGLPTGMEGLTYPIPFSSPEEVARIALHAEKLGFDSVWGNDHMTTQHYVRAEYPTPPRFWEHTEIRFSYDFSHAEGSYVYGVVPGGLPPPSPLPNVFNKLQQLRIDGRRRLTNNLAATVSYLYEPFDVYDFALDPTTIDSIIQPSSLVLGYVYRPYTVHSFVFGVRYYW